MEATCKYTVLALWRSIIPIDGILPVKFSCVLLSSWPNSAPYQRQHWQFETRNALSASGYMVDVDGNQKILSVAQTPQRKKLKPSARTRRLFSAACRLHRRSPSGLDCVGTTTRQADDEASPP